MKALLIVVSILAAVALLLAIVSARKRRLARASGPGTGSSVDLTSLRGFVRDASPVLALVIVATFLLWLYQSDLTVTKAASWMWGHLLFSLILAGVVIGLTEYFFPKKWWIPAGVAVFLLGAQGVNSFAPAAPVLTGPHCSDASRFEVRRCVMNGIPSKPIGPGDDGQTDEGTHLCVSSAARFERLVWKGTSYWKLTGPDGYIVQYQLFPAGFPCSKAPF